ncbi:MAG TPA: transposase, partial [Polyangia bacterium]|nr:transposase [Polyangia bacterium]
MDAQRRRKRQPAQLALKLRPRTWGGARPNSGRRKKTGAGVSHLRRPRLAARFPVHVVVRVNRETWNMRAGRCFRVLQRAFRIARDRFGMRLCHFSVIGNHLHLLIEATDEKSLSRGMQGLGVRMAKTLNRVMKKKGRVYSDRYYGRILKTPSEVARALNYVRSNAEKHGLIRRGIDPRSSWDRSNRDCVTAAATWLLAT